MKRKILVGGMLLALVIVAIGLIRVVRQNAAIVEAASTLAAPTFQVDPFWPKQLPHNWIFGSVAGIDVDARDHVWIIQRPTALPNTSYKAFACNHADSCTQAPPT